jgi:hypothetical protein
MRGEIGEGLNLIMNVGSYFWVFPMATGLKDIFRA